MAIHGGDVKLDLVVDSKAALADIKAQAAAIDKTYSSMTSRLSSSLSSNLSQAVSSATSQTTSKIAELEARAASLASDITEAKARTAELAAMNAEFERASSSLKSKLESLGETIKNAASKGANVLVSALGSIARLSILAAAAIGSLVSSALGLVLMQANAEAPIPALARLRDLLESLQNKFEQLSVVMQSVVTSAFMTMAEGIARAASVIADAATRALMAIGKLIDIFTGGRFSQVLKENAARQTVLSKTSAAAAQSTGSLSKAQQGAAKAAKAQDKAQKELNKTLASFDKINKLNSNSDSLGTSGGGGGVGDVLGGGGFGAPTDVSSWNEFRNTINDILGSIKLPQNLIDAISRFKKAFGDLADTIKSGLGWAWENIIKPFAKWVATEVAPRALDILTGVFKILNTILETLGETFAWLWDNFLKPITKAIGDEVLKALDGLAQGLGSIADWAKRNPQTFTSIALGIGAIAAALTGHPIAAALLAIVSALVAIKDTPIGDRLEELAQWAGEHKNIMALLGLNSMSDKLDRIANGLAILKAAFQPIADAIKGAFNSIGKAWEGFLNDHPLLKKLLDIIFGISKATTSGLGKILGKTTLLGQLTSLDWDTFDKGLDNVNKYGEALRGVDNKYKDISKTSKTAAARAKEFRTKEWAKIKSKNIKYNIEPGQSVSKVKNDYDQRANTWKNKTSNFGLKSSTSKATVKSWYTERSGLWLPKSVDFKVNTPTKSGTIKSAIDELQKKWNGKSVDFKVNSAATSVKTVSTNWSNRSKIFKGKTEPFKVNSAATTGSKVQGDWNYRSNKFRSKTEGFWVNSEKTPGWEVDKHWRALAWRWNNKTSWFEIRFSGDEWDIRSLANRALSSVESAIRSVSIFRNVSLPRFAQGAFVKRNSPLLAIIGDNRTEGEYVLPESKLAKFAEDTAPEADMSQVVFLLHELIAAVRSQDTAVYLDSMPLTRAVVNNVNKQTQITGRSPIIV